MDHSAGSLDSYSPPGIGMPPTQHHWRGVCSTRSYTRTTRSTRLCDGTPSRSQRHGSRSPMPSVRRKRSMKSHYIFFWLPIVESTKRAVKRKNADIPSHVVGRGGIAQRHPPEMCMGSVRNPSCVGKVLLSTTTPQGLACLARRGSQSGHWRPPRAQRLRTPVWR